MVIESVLRLENEEANPTPILPILDTTLYAGQIDFSENSMRLRSEGASPPRGLQPSRNLALLLSSQVDR